MEVSVEDFERLQQETLIYFEEWLQIVFGI